MAVSTESGEAAAKCAVHFSLFEEARLLIVSFYKLVLRTFLFLCFSPFRIDLVPTARDCPGYTASNVQFTNSSLTAHLHLAGKQCNIYGNDLKHLRFRAEYQTRIYPAGSFYDEPAY
jgi:hypothetical protein